MKLTYRGVPYTPTTAPAEVQETNTEGRFLGARFKMKKTRVHRRSYQSPVQLTYRGVNYTR